MATGAGQSGNKFVATLLRAGVGSHAAHATEVLLDRRPSVAEPFGKKAFRRWQDNLSQRVMQLAAAVEMGEPELFASDVRWSRDAFESRGVPAESLRESLVILGETLSESLPDGSFASVEPCLKLGLDECVSSGTVSRRLSPDEPLGRLALEYLELALGGDRRGAVRRAVAAYEAGTSIEDLYEGVLLAAEAEVGTMWHLGELTISEEHVVTETARAAMGVLSYLAASGQDAGGDRHTVVVSAVEGDRHDLGVRAVSDLLEVAGFRSVCLGASSPADEIARAMQDFEARLLVLSATMTTHLGAAMASIKAVRASRDGVKIIVGGEAFGAASDTLPETVGADAFAASPRAAVRLVGEMARSI